MASCGLILEKLRRVETQGQWRLLLGNRKSLEVVMAGQPLMGHRVDFGLNVGDRFRPRRCAADKATAKRENGSLIDESQNFHGDANEQEDAISEGEHCTASSSFHAIKTVHMPLSDRLPPDAIVDPGAFEWQLNFLCKTQEDCGGEQDVTVLVNCNLCVNRSPSLILLFLIRCEGYSLREAYKRLFRAGHRSIDPLPPYRRMLVDVEKQQSGVTTIGADDLFALHFTDERFAAMDFDTTLELRNDSITRLLKEEL